MATSSAVTWKNDVSGGGRVAIESVDPRTVWLDPTYRNLYRVRELEIDYADLQNMVAQTDGRGEAIFNPNAMQAMITDAGDQMRVWREQMSGGNHTISSSRNPVKIDEYLATVVGNDGKFIIDK